MLDGLITSKMRVQILMRLFLNANSRAYLRELSKEFGASPGHVRSELQQLAQAGLLSSEREGRQVYYRATRSHPLFPDLQSMVRKTLGMDRILDSILERLGHLEAAYLSGDYAEGRDTGIIDLILVGDIDRHNLDDLVAKTERYIGRRIRTLVLSSSEFQQFDQRRNATPILCLWGAAQEEPNG
ncbi:MAG: winged helix-turn-helix transcriptional regulator [Gammaproteobacteria bacterium]|nr:winged helix-turn-helix transcriptional regulator [Gammaproteobacteria bacterium]